MATKEIGNLYGVIYVDNDEILTETPLNLIQEKDILKFNYIFSSLLDKVDNGGERFMKTMSTGFNSLIYEIINNKFEDDDKAYSKTKEFESFLTPLVLNTKIYYRGKEMAFPEFSSIKDDTLSDTMVRFNICFFLSMFIVLSNTTKMIKNKEMTVVQEGFAYIGLSTLGEFHSFVQNMKVELSSQNA